MNNKHNTALFIKYLRKEIKCDWSEANFQHYRPIVAAYKGQQALSVRNHMKFISHIVKEDGLSFTSNEDVDGYAWVKYKGRYTACIRKSDIYSFYKIMCEKFRYPNVHPYDQFIENLIAILRNTILIMKAMIYGRRRKRQDFSDSEWRSDSEDEEAGSKSLKSIV